MNVIERIKRLSQPSLNGTHDLRGNDMSKLVTHQAGIRLDIACGAAKQPGFFGMDLRDLPGVDMVWDVERHPWPLPDEIALMATASHLVEHLNPSHFGIIHFFDEVWRVLKPGGEFWIVCPHGLSQGYRQDPTHTKAWDEATFSYFDPWDQYTQGGLYRIYQPKPWKIKFLTWNPAANIECVLVKRKQEAWFATGQMPEGWTEVPTRYE